MNRILMLALLLGPASSAMALTIEPLSGEVLFGPAVGETALGSFTYDETLVVGVGDEIFDIFDGLTIELAFLGKDFTEFDDTDFDFFPTLSFFDGEPVILNYVIIDSDGVGIDIDDPRMDGFSIFGIVPDPAGGFAAEITTFFVPEPSALALLGLGLCAWGANTRRR